MTLFLGIILIVSSNLLTSVDSRIFNVSGMEGFVGALDEVKAGDKIFLQSGIYAASELELPELGRAKSHTLITSAAQNASSVVFIGPGKVPPLIVNGTRWALTRLTITNKFEKDIGVGLVLKQDEAFLKGLVFRDVDVAVQSEGKKLTVQDCEVHATKVGLYVYGNESVVTGNRIYGANPCLYVDDLSCCGVVKGNRCDVKGAIFVNGPNYEMDDWTKQQNDLNRVEFMVNQ